jgi:hypothetical protein
MTTTLTQKVRLEFAEISRRLHKLQWLEVNVAGIGRGIFPASLIAYQLERSPQLMRVNDHDDDHKSCIASARLFKRLLLVDGVNVIAATLNVAQEIPIGLSIITLTSKGKADFALLLEVSLRVIWPWSAQ